MNTHSLFARSYRMLLLLVLAAILALSAAYAPILLDATAGTSMTNTAFACAHTGGGC